MDGRLIVTEGGRDRVHELCDDLTVVGRGLDCDLMLKDASVAAIHCEIRRTPEGFKVVDRETRAGTVVNGRPVNQHFLKHGDTVELGGARLTFLGSSAPEAKKPRHAVEEPLRELPTDEEGRPRRFYRHEQQQPLPAYARAAIAAAGVCGLLLIIVFLSRPEAREKSVAEFRRARSLIDQGTEASLRQAIAIINALPRGEVDERLVEEEKLRAEGALFTMEREARFQEASLAVSRIDRLFEATPPDLSQLRSEISYFRERYPDDPRARDLEARLSRLGGGVLDLGARFEQGLAAISRALKESRWKAAFQELRTLESDALMKDRYGDRLGVIKTTLESRFSAYFETQQERALAAHASGESAEAAAIFRELVDVGHEPYAGNARRLLERVQ